MAEQFDREDGSSGVQADPNQVQWSGHSVGDTKDLVELQIILSKSSKAPNLQYKDIKPYLGESSEAPFQIGEDLPYYL